MTLDETIKEFTDWAKDNRKEQNYWAAERDENDETNPLSYADCEGLARDAETRAEYHEQLAEWLTELKELRRLVDLVAKYAGKSEDICERYLPSIDGDLCVTDGMGASNCTCCGYEYRCDYKTDRRKNK